MKKIFLFLFALVLFSCAGEIYQEEITIKEGLAYKKDSNSLYSGTVLDRYGEPLGSYKKGLKDGEWIYDVGDVIIKGKYRDGYKNGKWTETDKNTGKIIFEGNFIDGEPDGIHKYYYPNGKIKEEQYWEAGVPVKTWKKYDIFGNVEIETEYRDGKIFKINGARVEQEKP